ncbi:MAG: hypothetical protein V1679_00170 [Candidatus Peregrinibacteria bacterium]
MPTEKKKSGDENVPPLRLRPFNEVVALTYKDVDDARPDGLKFRDIEDYNPEFPIIMATPRLSTTAFAVRALRAKAVVFVVFASGATPTRFAPVIKACIDRGVPVFLVSDNMGDNHGILEAGRYGTTSGSLEAGAVPIETVNVNNLAEIKTYIKLLSGAGKTGTELAELVGERFSYRSDDEKPLAEWDTPGGVAKQRQLTRLALMKAGFKGEELEEQLHRWEFGDKPDDAKDK